MKKSKKQKGPITDFSVFLKACRTLKKYGYVFEVVECPYRIPVPNEKATVGVCAIWWRSSSMSYFNPIDIICWVHYSISTTSWRIGTMSAQATGMKKGLYKRIKKAMDESDGFCTETREQILDALGLEDIPYHKRSTYKKERKKKHGKRRTVRR